MADAEGVMAALFDQAWRCKTCSSTIEGRGLRAEYCAPCKRERRKAKDRRRYASHRIPVEHTCQFCGATFRPKEANRTSFCSRSCFQQSTKPADQVVWRAHAPRSAIWTGYCIECAAPMVSRRKRLRCEAHAAAWVKATTYSPRPKVVSRCVCGAAIKGTAAKRVCARCAKVKSRSVRKHSQRARLYGGAYETVDPLKVFARDKWKCQLCGTATPKRLRGTVDMAAPELDHIIPLSKGGDHSYLNTQCACRSCNISKGSRAMGQMRLFA